MEGAPPRRLPPVRQGSAPDGAAGGVPVGRWQPDAPPVARAGGVPADAQRHAPELEEGGKGGADAQLTAPELEGGRKGDTNAQLTAPELEGGCKGGADTPAPEADRKSSAGSSSLNSADAAAAAAAAAASMLGPSAPAEPSRLQLLKLLVSFLLWLWASVLVGALAVSAGWRNDETRAMEGASRAGRFVHAVVLASSWSTIVCILWRYAHQVPARAYALAWGTGFALYTATLGTRALSNPWTDGPVYLAAEANFWVLVNGYMVVGLPRLLGRFPKRHFPLVNTDEPSSKTHMFATTTGVVAMGVAFALLSLFSSASLFYMFAPIAAALFAQRLWVDRAKAIYGDSGYILALSAIAPNLAAVVSVALGALILDTDNSRGRDNVAQIYIVLVFPVFAAAVHLLWGAMARRAVPMRHAMATLLPLSLFEDLYFDLAFILLEAFGGLWWLAVSLQFLRTLIRDGGYAGDARRFMVNLYRRRNGLAPHPFNEIDALNLWRFWFGSALSEAAAASSIIVIILAEETLDGRNPGALTALEAGERTQAIFGYLTILVIEAVAHTCCFLLLRRRIAKFQRTAASEAPSRRGTIGDMQAGRLSFFAQGYRHVATHFWWFVFASMFLVFVSLQQTRLLRQAFFQEELEGGGLAGARG